MSAFSDMLELHAIEYAVDELGRSGAGRYKPAYFEALLDLAIAVRTARVALITNQLELDRPADVDALRGAGL